MSVTSRFERNPVEHGLPACLHSGKIDVKIEENHSNNNTIHTTNNNKLHQ